MTEKKAEHDPWETTARMQALTAKRRKEGNPPQTARGRFTPPRTRGGTPSHQFAAPRSPEFAHLGDYLGAHA